MSSLILRQPAIFAAFPELVAGISLRQGITPPYQDANFSYRPLKDVLSPGNYHAITKTVQATRRELLSQTLGESADARFVHQTHSDQVITAATGSDLEGTSEADAIISVHPKQLIGVFLADCAGILLYEPEAKIIAAIHSGWRGTKANITGKTISHMQALGAQPTRIHAYVSPVACPAHYPVGETFADYFEARFLPRINNEMCFDNHAAIEAQLQAAGVTHIELDKACTVEDPKLHSYRRDGQLSGRTVAFIGFA